MESDEVMIQVYDKREKITLSFYVKKLSNNIYRMEENSVCYFTLTYGTEFETRLNKESVLEVVRILRKSTFITRRFSLNVPFKESELRVLGDEIMKIGGFWQVDFGSMATINLPKDASIDIDEIFRIFNFTPTEIFDE